MLDALNITPEDPAELRAINRLLANEVKALTLKVEASRVFRRLLSVRRSCDDYKEQVFA
jgi:hypothetical protein